MNDRIVLTGVSLLIANLFVLFSGFYSIDYYIFLIALAAGVIISITGAVVSSPKGRAGATVA